MLVFVESFTELGRVSLLDYSLNIMNNLCVSDWFRRYSSVIYCRASTECNQILVSLSLDGGSGEEAVKVGY